MREPMLIVTVFFIACAILTPAGGAEIKCTNVEDKAVTHHKSSVSWSKTESGKDCTISIDGATASSKTAEPIALLFSCMKHVRLNNVNSKNFAAQVVPTLAGASVDNFELTRWITFPPTDDGCDNFLRELSDRPFDSDLHREVRDRQLVDSIATMLPGQRIEFETSFGKHTVFLSLQ